MLPRKAKAGFYALAGPAMRWNGALYRRLRAPRGGRVRVQLGPGQKNYFDGWVNVDANMFTGKCDVWADLRNPLPFHDATVDAFYSHHVVEHLPDLRSHVRDVHRCLKPGGAYRVGGPNGDWAVRKFLENDREWFHDFPDRFESIGGKLQNFLLCRQEHLTILTFSLLEELLGDAGFTEIRACLPVRETRFPDLFDGPVLAKETEGTFDCPHTLIVEAEEARVKGAVPRRIVTFTTDFGERDTYAGQLLGATLSVCPDVVPVDLTHDVPSHDVAAGAFLLESGYRAFPRGTIHVVVVDPGVGTSRRAVGVRTDGYYFLAPDNGLLSRVLDEERVESAHVLEAAHYRRATVSATFEGRDVFAPAAGWLARGVDLANFGPPAGDLVRLPAAPPIAPGAPVRLRVVLVDRFGNAILDVKRSVLEPFLGAGRRLVVRALGGAEITELRRTYGDGAGTGPFLLFGSSGYLEIAMREASAAERLGLARGTEVELAVV